MPPWDLTVYCTPPDTVKSCWVFQLAVARRDQRGAVRPSHAAGRDGLQVGVAGVPGHGDLDRSGVVVDLRLTHLVRDDKAQNKLSPLGTGSQSRKTSSVAR